MFSKFNFDFFLEPWIIQKYMMYVPKVWELFCFLISSLTHLSSRSMFCIILILRNNLKLGLQRIQSIFVRVFCILEITCVLQTLEIIFQIHLLGLLCQYLLCLYGSSLSSACFISYSERCAIIYCDVNFSPYFCSLFCIYILKQYCLMNSNQ